MSNATPGPPIPERWNRIVEAIADGPSAWMTPTALASALGLDEDETLDEVASMDVGGLLDLWERAEGLVVTLSALSASRLGRHLIEQGPSGQLRWARDGEPEPAPPPARHVVRSSASASFEFLIDPRPGPEALAEVSQQARHFRDSRPAGASRGGDDRAEPPRPTMLIGTCLIPWPGPASSGSGRCPACDSRRLPPNAYCLCCDRWGMDDANEAPSRSRGRARRPKDDRILDPDRLAEASAIERQRRKERRTTRLAQRFERQRRDRLQGRGRRRGHPA
jgi:hypothetical protein